jgi:hypothetical protein
MKLVFGKFFFLVNDTSSILMVLECAALGRMVLFQSMFLQLVSWICPGKF